MRRPIVFVFTGHILRTLDLVLITRLITL
jgi:hypothetical protein